MEVCVWCCLLYTVGAVIIYKLLDRLIRYPYVNRILSRQVLVTGCDTGFGHEIVKRLDRRGCTVFAGCLTEKGETILKKMCSIRVTTFHLNVADPESIKKGYEFVKKNIREKSGLWAVLNNAGIAGRIGPIEWLTKKDYDQVFDVNLHGLINVTTTFLPLIKKEKGRVINTASVVGRFSVPGSTPYAISKYGVEAFSDGLRRQLRSYNCRCIIIEPGFHKTHITSAEYLTQMYKEAWDQISPEMKEEYGEEFYQKSVDLLLTKFIERISSDRIADVVDAYENAVLGLVPRNRYLVGFDANYFWIPVGFLPEWLGDLILDLGAMDKPVPASLKKDQ